MSLVDFSRFIDELATLSGQAILPFFRSSLAPDNKARGVLSGKNLAMISRRPNMSGSLIRLTARVLLSQALIHGAP
jgi:hypothetical protein